MGDDGAAQRAFREEQALAAAGHAPLRRQADGSYAGIVNLTMTGLWRIHLTVRDSQGNVVAGGDNLSDGFSSLYWDVTI